MAVEPPVGSGPTLEPSELDELARSFELDPKNRRALIRLSRHYHASDSPTEVTRLLRRHLAAVSGGPASLRSLIASDSTLDDPSRALLLVYVARVQSETLEDPDGALASVRAALKLDSGCEPARVLHEALSRQLESRAASGRYLWPTPRRGFEGTVAARPSALPAAGDDEDDPPTTPGAMALGAMLAQADGVTTDPGMEDIPPTETVELPSTAVDDDPQASADAAFASVSGPDSELEPGRSATVKVASLLAVDEDSTGAVELPEDDEDERTELDAEDSDDVRPEIAAQCQTIVERGLPMDVAVSALHALERSASAASDRALIHRTVGTVYERGGDRDRSFYALVRASRLVPPPRQLMDELFRLAVFTGAFSELAAVYEDTLGGPLDPADRVYLHLKLGHLYGQELSRPSAALRHYRRVVTVDADNFEAHRRIGELLERTTEWNGFVEAKRAELAAVQRATGDVAQEVRIRRELARAYEEHLDDGQAAVEQFEALLELTPGNPAALSGLERLAESDGGVGPGAQAAFARLRAELRRIEAWPRLADLLSESARHHARRQAPLEAAALHREAAEVLERHLGDPGRGFVELVRAVQILPQGEAAVGAGLDPRAVDAATDALTDDLFRLGRASRSHAQLTAIAEDLALRLGSERGAELLVRVAEMDLEDLGDAGRAAARMARAVELSGNDPGVQARLEGLYVSRGAWAELADYYEARAERLEDPAARGEVLFRLAELLEGELDDRPAAVAVYESLLELPGVSGDALSPLARLLEEGQDWRGLVTALERAVNAAPDLPGKKGALLRRASVSLEHLGDPATARADWQRVLALDPECVEALQGLADTAEEEGDARELAAALETRLAGMRSGEPGRLDGYRRLARLYGGDRLARPAQARMAWEEVVAEASDDIEAFRRLRVLYRERGDLEPLADLLDRRLGSHPRDAEAKEWRRERVEALQSLGRSDEVGREWDRAVRVDPSDIEALERLAAFHTARKAWPRVVKTLDHWISATRDRREKGSLYARLGDIRRQALEDLDGAIEAYEKALKFHPEERRAQTALLEHYRRIGDLRRAFPLMSQQLAAVVSGRDRSAALREVWTVGRDLRDQGVADAGLRAVEALKEACLLVPEDDALWSALEEELSGPSRAVELAGHLEARAARLEGAPRAESLLKAAEAWRLSGGPHDDRSRERYRRALERARDAAPADHPVAARVLTQLRAAYTAAGAWEALAGILEELARPEASPGVEDRRLAIEELAYTLQERLGRATEAADWLARMVELAPDDAKDAELARLADLERELGRWKRVADLYDARVRHARGSEEESSLRLEAAEIALQRLDDPGRAIGHLRSALALRPGDTIVLLRLERACMDAGRHGELGAILAEEAGRTEDPEIRAELLVRAAAIKEEHLGDVAGARRDLESVVQLEGVSAELKDAAQSGLIRTLSAQRDFERLAGLYRELVEGEREPEIRGDLCVALGLVYEEQLQETARALATYRQALETDPENTAALDAVARLAESGGDIETAIEMRRRQADVAVSAELRGELLAKAGRLHELRDEFDEALECYRRAAADVPRAIPPRRAMLRLLRTRGDEADTLATARSLAVLTSDPLERAELWTEIGEILESGGKVGEAISAYEHALGSVPDHVPAALPLAGQLLRHGHAEQSLEVLEVVLHRLASEKSPDRVAEASTLAAAACAELGRDGDVATYLDRAYSLGPTQRDVLERIATLLESRADHERAYEVLRTLLELHGGQADGRQRRGWLVRTAAALAAMGRPGDAASVLHEALETDPGDREVLSALAEVYEQVGRWTDALDTLVTLRELTRFPADRRVLALRAAEIASAHLLDADQATELLRSALEDHPGDVEILERLAREQERLGAFPDAVASLETLLSARLPEERRAEVWIRLGDLRWDRLADSAAAVEAYRQAIETATVSDHVEAALEGIRELSTMSRNATPLAEVLSWLADREGPGPGEALLRRELAEVRRYQLDDTEGAIAALERVLSLEADDLKAAEDLARLYERAEMHPQAAGAYRKVLHHSPFEIDAYRGLRRSLEASGEADGAAMVAALLELLEEADEDELEMAAALAASPRPSTTLDESVRREALDHPSLRGTVGDLVGALGAEGAALMAPTGRAARARTAGVFTAESGPFAERIADALLSAVRLLGIRAADLHLAADDATAVFEPLNLPRPSLRVSRAVVQGEREIDPSELTFLAARALVAVQPEVFAARALTLAQLTQLAEASVVLAGTAERLGAAPDRETTRLAKRLEKTIPPDRQPRLVRAARTWAARREEFELAGFVEAVEHTAVRAGLLVVGSPVVAVRALRSEGEVGRVTLRELVRYAVSPDHLALRRRVGCALPSRTG